MRICSRGLARFLHLSPMVISQFSFDTETSFWGTGTMLTTGFDATTNDAETNETETPNARSKFYPIMGSNISVQAIVEGSLLADIDLDPVPEYGIHY